MIRIREVAVDAYRNTGWQHLLAVLATALAMTGASALLVTQAASSVQQEVALQQAGSTVWSIAADDDAPFSAAQCAGLAMADGVMAAGGILLGTPPTLSHLPSAQDELPVVLMTPNFARVFAPQTPPGAVTVGSELVDLGQVSAGQRLWVDGETQVVLESELPAWVPLAQLNAGIALPTAADGDVAECWVRMEPGVADQGGALLNAWLGSNLRVSQFAPPARSASPWEQWAALAGIQPGLAAGTFCCLLGAVLHWNRRPEYSVRRIFGSSAAQIGAMSAVEWALVALPAVAISGVVVLGSCALGWLPTVPESWSLTASTCGSAALLAVAGNSLLGRIFAATASVDALRDR